MFMLTSMLMLFCVVDNYVDDANGNDDDDDG